MKQQLDTLNLWYSSLPSRDRKLLVAVSILLITTLFYLMVWEPIHQGRDQQQQKFKSQQEIYAWMQSASQEAIALKRTGAGNIKKASTQPLALILESSAKISGLKQNINKIESSGKSGARVKIDSASFDQLLVWLNTLEQQHGVTVTTASIERNDTPGTISARLSFEKI
ncbi:MAG: type II secretion system protein M [Gammaproteobacteria bacterium]|nr:type II secretion system protein M [Gammaproteobacteria bacterium]MCW8922795.1 type II secretion system protein M [Gammaproteobacteria bacterium]